MSFTKYKEKGKGSELGGAPRARDKQKESALEAALQQIRKAFGAGAVHCLGDTQVQEPEETISSGSLSVDWALGVGGFPVGRIVEVYGPESSGKTTLALQTIAQAQKKGEPCAFIDVEHAFDPIYAQNLGIDMRNLYVSQPDTGEQALEILDTWIASGAVKVVVLDSVAALVPKAELEGDMGDSHMGLQARLMSQALRKLTGSISKAKTLVIFINQIRQKIGVMFGNPETTTGGNALKFYASVRLDIRRIGSIKEKDAVIGNQTKVKVVKNKVAPPFRETTFSVFYGNGISRFDEIIDFGVKFEILDKSGSWYRYQGDNIGQGKEAAKSFLEENPETAQEIEEAIKERLTGGLILDAEGARGGSTEPGKHAHLAKEELPEGEAHLSESNGRPVQAGASSSEGPFSGRSKDFEAEVGPS